MYAYVGSRTTRERNARGEGISVYRVDPQDDRLELVQLVSDLVNPSFLCLNKCNDRLYAVHGDGHEVSVFSVSPKDGTLQFLQRQECGGLNPVHLALDPTEKFLVISDHLGENGGTLAVMPVNDDGGLGAVEQRVGLVGTPGPHRKEQAHAKPHFNPFEPTGRFVVVPDKGFDRVFVFRFEDGRLTPASTPWMDTREGAGPRHVAFHPTRPFAYVVTELDSTVMACGLDAETGALTPLQVLSCLPDAFTGNSRASEISVAQDGRTLYASNRGYDSIAVFHIDLETGFLTFSEATQSMGQTPRFFAISPGNSVMYVLNEDSDSIATFHIDIGTGKLKSTPMSLHCGSPVCMVFSSTRGS
ncbi:lactonase family protein [Polaromonas sp. SM01]|uniref:lactonase family protein n=1 Tax=Polaromonas sp. SM01 TaxID=3085630 RepID=UPI0029814641|nr:lactonase family protein [Polaromonas sp. SM01]MDW5442910.1 lactonase family protein [Polaromonas sp. SM01]